MKGMKYTDAIRAHMFADALVGMIERQGERSPKFKQPSRERAEANNLRPSNS